MSHLCSSIHAKRYPWFVIVIIGTVLAAGLAIGSGSAASAAESKSSPAVSSDPGATIRPIRTVRPVRSITPSKRSPVKPVLTIQPLSGKLPVSSATANHSVKSKQADMISVKPLTATVKPLATAKTAPKKDVVMDIAEKAFKLKPVTVNGATAKPKVTPGIFATGKPKGNAGVTSGHHLKPDPVNAPKLTIRPVVTLRPSATAKPLQATAGLISCPGYPSSLKDLKVADLSECKPVHNASNSDCKWLSVFDWGIVCEPTPKPLVTPVTSPVTQGTPLPTGTPLPPELQKLVDVLIEGMKD